MTKKKKTKISNVSHSNGTADNKADTSILSPSIPEIVLKGQSTLKDHRTPRFKLPEEIKTSKYPLITIVISNKFQGSLKYVFLPKISP